MKNVRCGINEREAPSIAVIALLSLFYVNFVSAQQAIVIEVAPEPPKQAESYEKPTAYVVTAYAVGDRYTPSHGVTASGKRVEPNVTAACPPELALGTRIDIEGVGERVCTDRGGRIRGNRIDVFMTSEKAALNFGKRTLEVTIIDEKGAD